MVEQKDFDKLKQSDRIEYLLRENRLEKKKEDSYIDWSSLNYCIIGIVGFLMILTIFISNSKNLGLVNGGIEEIKQVAIGVILFSKVLLIFAVVFTIFGIIWNIYNRKINVPKWDEKLESYFFKTETKPKNNTQTNQGRSKKV